MLLNEGLLLRLGFCEYLENGFAVGVEWIAALFLSLVVAYLLGSVNSGIIVSRLVYHDDVRKYGSGNAGLTNVMRTYGKKAAGLTLLGDTLKMVLSLLVAGFLFGFDYHFGMSMNFVMYLVGLFCIIGHIKPIYYHFKGGKGVLSFATLALILTPLQFLFLFLVFVLIVWMTKYISLGSIVCAAFYPLVLQGWMQAISGNDEGYNGFIVLIAMLAAAILIFCHRKNIKRLLNHTENKFSFHKHEKKALPEDEKDGTK